MALARAPAARGLLHRVLAATSAPETARLSEQALASGSYALPRRWLSAGGGRAPDAGSKQGSAAGGEQQQASSSGASSSGNGASSSGSAFDASQAFEGVKQGFSSFKQRVAGGGGGDEPLGERAGRLWTAALRDLRDAVLPREERNSLTRAYEGPLYEGGAGGEYDGPTALAAVRVPKTRMQQVMDDLRERFGHHPLFQRLSSTKLGETPLVRKAGELAEDLRDKYETSDHPAIHKIEDVRGRVFALSDAAAAMQEIRARDPNFDMARLLAGVKVDAPVVVKAFLTHDLETLRRHCGPELCERFAGIFAHFAGQGLVEDPTILFVADAELVELRLADDDPLVVVQFNCQQLKCTRDKFGNVIDGSPSSIQKVFYFWGLQQDKQGVVLPDGRVLRPRWVLKDMMWQSQLMLA